MLLARLASGSVSAFLFALAVAVCGGSIAAADDMRQDL